MRRLLPFLLILIVLTGCSVQNEPVPFDKIALNTLYETTDLPNVYHLSLPELEGWCIDAGQLKDGYVLLTLHRMSGEESEMQELLFPLSRPGDAVSIAVPDAANIYTLLSDGQVITSYEDGHFRLFDDQFRILQESEPEQGFFIGASEEGLWFACDNELHLYSDGAVKCTFSSPGIAYMDRYLGTIGGKLYFSASDEAYNTCILRIDLTGDSCEKLTNVLRWPSIYEGMLSYYADDMWYIAPLDTPDLVTSFSRCGDGETIWRMDNRLAIAEEYLYDEATEDVDTLIRVYDLSNGGVCDTLSEDILQSDEGVELLDYTEGLLLLRTGDWESSAPQSLYLMDLRTASAEIGADSYSVTDYGDASTDIDTMVEELEATYPIHIYYDAFGLAGYNMDYHLTPAEDEQTVKNCLVSLQDCLAEYPDGFITDLLGEGKEALNIYLCGGFEATMPDALADPAASVNTTGSCLHLSIDVDYWWDLRQTLLHEMMHLCEHRITEYIVAHNLLFYGYWDDVMNTAEYPYFYSYTEQPESEKYYAGTAFSGEGEAWFIDPYAKSNGMEDRARTLEYALYDVNAFYYENAPLLHKLQLLCGMLREAFPSVATCEEEQFWEHRTGIVDLHEQFPDLFTFQYTY